MNANVCVFCCSPDDLTDELFGIEPAILAPNFLINISTTSLVLYWCSYNTIGSHIGVLIANYGYLIDSETEILTKNDNIVTNQISQQKKSSSPITL